MVLVISWFLRDVFSYGVTAANNSEIVLCCCLLASLAIFSVDFLATHSSNACGAILSAGGGLLYFLVLWQQFCDSSYKLPFFSVSVTSKPK